MLEFGFIGPLHQKFIHKEKTQNKTIHLLEDGYTGKLSVDIGCS